MCYVQIVHILHWIKVAYAEKSNRKILVNVFLAMNREKSRRAGTTYCYLTLFGTTVRTPQSMLSPDGIMKRFVVQPVVGDIHQATRTAILNTLG